MMTHTNWSSVIAYGCIICGIGLLLGPHVAAYVLIGFGILILTGVL